MQQCDGLLDDPAVDTQPGAVVGAATGEFGVDPLAAQHPAVFVVVVGAVGVERAGAATGASAPSTHRRNRFDQWGELGDVVAVAAGQCRRERDTVPLGDDMMLGAGPCTIYRARTGFRPP